jgi:PEGA domain
MNFISAIILAASGLALAGCSSVALNMSDMFTPPAVGTLMIDSNPPGAEARVSTGGACRTPCELSVPFADRFTVTYDLDGYLPQTVPIRTIPIVKSALIDMTPPEFKPNPVSAELKPAPPPEPPPPVNRRQRPQQR